MKNFQAIIDFIKNEFSNEDFIPLHAPTFVGNEKKYLNECIDSTFVSSVGEFVTRFEKQLAEYTGANHAVACVNGTSALHIALLLTGVQKNDEVISQALTFIATANAISYIGATPVFVDVDKDTMGMSPDALECFLNTHVKKKADGYSYNKMTGKKISACLPMHTFGFPCRIQEIASICERWNIALVEDTAESLGSLYNGKHTGNFGKVAAFSFNGNKTITCGGGGALITNDKELAKKAKHITTQAKLDHAWKFIHDQIAYNYRMPNINAALACAQLEQIDTFLKNKRKLAQNYNSFFSKTSIDFVNEIVGARANYWLNTIILSSEQERDAFLELSNKKGIMTRPTWELMNTLPMFNSCQSDDLTNSKWLAERVVNIPSSART